MSAERTLAELLALHVRGDWSDRTFSCMECANRVEDRNNALWEERTEDERRQGQRDYYAATKPDWSLADYHAHVAAVIVRDWLPTVGVQS